MVNNTLIIGGGIIGLMTARELLSRERDPGETQIRDAISGNLCRCTGYTKIVEAIQAVGKGDEGQ